MILLILYTNMYSVQQMQVVYLQRRMELTKPERKILQTPASPSNIITAFVMLVTSYIACVFQQPSRIVPLICFLVIRALSGTHLSPWLLLKR
ncbi:hypothetical protein BC827DRAFT_1209790 [Russula dissimulans]|nr:hypothetical protein BC827DRAFT_1209790 [Russula dissimulans]